MVNERITEMAKGLRYQVFISSTFEDLRVERQRVIDHLWTLDYIPAGMENFPATGARPWEQIRRVIDLSDYYVVIVAGRYGSITDEGLSYTESEFDYAVEKGIPTFGFLHTNPRHLSIAKSDVTRQTAKKLEAFRKKVRKNGVAAYDSPDSLAAAVGAALRLAEKVEPRRVGWIRGDVMQLATKEIERLEAELNAIREATTSGSPSLSNEELAPNFIHSTMRQRHQQWLLGSSRHDPRSFELYAPHDALQPFLESEYSDDELESFMLMSACQGTSRDQGRWSERNQRNNSAGDRLAELLVTAYLHAHRAPVLRALVMISSLGDSQQSVFLKRLRQFESETPSAFIEFRAEMQSAVDQMSEGVGAFVPQAMTLGQKMGLTPLEARRTLSSWLGGNVVPAWLAN